MKIPTEGPFCYAGTHMFSGRARTLGHRIGSQAPYPLRHTSCIGIIPTSHYCLPKEVITFFENFFQSIRLRIEYNDVSKNNP